MRSSTPCTSRTAPGASFAYPSAPISSANSAVIGAPPTTIRTRSRSPASRDRLDHLAHVRHRRRQQRGQRDHVGAVAGRLDEPVGVDVGAEVVDLEPGALQHHRDQVLADVVHVALDRADRDPAAGADVLLDEVGTQDLERALHRVRGDEHLGDEDLAVLEELADGAHRGHQPVLEQARRGDRLRQPLLRQRDGLGGAAVDDGVAQLVGRGHRRGPPSPDSSRYSPTASYSASRFSTGMPAWTLWTGVEDEAAAAAEDLDPLADLAADLVGRAEGQRLLRVDAAAPERDPVAEASASARRGPCPRPSTAPG